MVIDGNFKQKHMLLRRLKEVYLAGGTGFMQGPKSSYTDHLTGRGVVSQPQSVRSY